jgi:hypothetical protein
MLTISRLKRHSIKYYNDTADETKQAAMDRQRANGGLAEYYSEGETRIPTWLIVGDKQHIGQATGLTDAQLEGGDADTEHARIWLDDGQSPNGNTGREFTDKSVHGFDLTFAAPKSVSLLRALTDDIAEKVLATAHTKAVHAAMPTFMTTPATPASTTGSPATATCNGCPAWWPLPTSMRRRAAATRICTPTLSCPTANPEPTANWSPSTRRACTTRPRPPASSTKPPSDTSFTPNAASNGIPSTATPAWPKSPASPKTPSRHGRSAPRA